MDFFIDLTNCIAIANFELHKILVFGVEAILEVRKRIFFLAFFQLIDDSLHLHSDIALHFPQHFQQFRVPFLVLSVIFYHVLVEEEENHLVNVKLESKHEKGRKKVVSFNLSGNFLDKAHLIDFPLNRCSSLSTRFLLGGFFFNNFSFQERVLPQSRYCNSALHINIEDLGEQVIV